MKSDEQASGFGVSDRQRPIQIAFHAQHAPDEPCRNSCITNIHFPNTPVYEITVTESAGMQQDRPL